MAKDAGGHGSDATDGQAAAALASGPKSSPAPVHSAMAPIPAEDGPHNISDQTYQGNMPHDTYKGMVGDMLGMWSGSQKSEPFSPAESKIVESAYSSRRSFRDVAAQLHDARRAK